MFLCGKFQAREVHLGVPRVTLWADRNVITGNNPPEVATVKDLSGPNHFGESLGKGPTHPGLGPSSTEQRGRGGGGGPLVKLARQWPLTLITSPRPAPALPGAQIRDPCAASALRSTLNTEGGEGQHRTGQKTLTPGRPSESSGMSEVGSSGGHLGNGHSR